MLKHSTTATALLLVIACAPVHAAWNVLDSGTDEALEDVHFPVSGSIGWAVGDNGTILKTTSAGTSWFLQTSGSTDILFSVHFPEDELTGFVAGSGGTILKTTDGGATWSALSSGTTLDLRDVHFPVSGATGWVVGSGGTILRTTDGGSNWSTQTSGTLERLESVLFPAGESTGYTLGDQGILFKTTNGGADWGPQTSSLTQLLFDLHFPTGAEIGWLVGASGGVAHTTDGTVWSAQASGTPRDLRGVRFLDASTGWAAGANGTIVKTTDGGASWSPEASGTPNSLHGIDFPSASIGYAVGEGGTILRRGTPDPPTISSLVDQSFLSGANPVAMRAITVTEGAPPMITAQNDLRIRVPAGFPMTWDPSIAVASLSGPAASKVSSAVSLEDANKTLVLQVTADFTPSDAVTVSGLRYASFGAPSPPDRLELETRNDGIVNDEDDKVITILSPRANHSSSLDLRPDGTELWVVNPDHASVSVIGTQGSTENQLLAEIPVGREPWTLDAHPTKNEVWVASQRDDRIYIIDAVARTVVDSFAAGFETFGIAFDPSGTTALVTASGSDQILAIDAYTRTTFQTLSAYRRPRGIAWKSDGTRAWATHLLMPEHLGRLTTVFPASWTTSVIAIQQVFGSTRAGYPSTMQTAALAPDGIHLWIPNNMINTSAGALFGNPLTPLNIVHACIRPVNTVTSTDRNLDTYFLSEGGSPNLGFPGGTTPVGGPIQVAFQGGRAYVANLHSDNVTVLNDNIFSPAEIDVIPAGSAPIGVLAHPTLNRVYVHNWLSRDVTVIDTANLAVVATVATTTSEVLPSPVLNGKRLFFTGQGPMSLDGRGACASCHVFGKHDGRMWDLSQFGKHVRATPDIRGIAFTGAHDFTADKNEMADHDLGIVEFMGGDGLIPSPNPPLGPPNAGLSQDMDDIGIFMSILEHRPDTPFLAPGGGLTAEADSGRALFFDPAVGCATCHVPPFFSDSRLPQPFIKHVVGTANPGDLDAAPGFDTPSLVGVWDNAPYLHHHLAQTLLSVMTTFNPNDLHGATSQLTSAQLEKIVAYLKSLAHPDSAGVSVVAPETLGDVSGALEAIFPNPFDEKTSLRFSTEKSPSQVTIEIFNVEGRRVRRLLDAPMARGIHIVGWDARNDSGRRVAPGTYYANLFVDRARRAGKTMTVVR